MSGLIILPTDTKTEELRKELVKLVKTPQQREFERYKSEGLDSETAADLSGLTEMAPETRTSIMLDYARQYQASREDVEYVAVNQTNQALRSVGSAAGAAIGSTVGMSIFRFVGRHRQVLTAAGVAGGGVVLAVTATKLVAAAFGTKVAALAAANILSAVGIVAAAFWKVGR